MDKVVSGLNNAQKCAVTSPSAVLQVLAPPGSGKTKTLTARVAYLIAHDGYKPWNIVVCTFTNKAAREMKERIQGFLGDNLEQKLVLGTFHSIALRYLRTYGHHIGLDKNFGIADSADSMAILKRIKKRHKYNIEPPVARSRISKIKARSVAVQPFKGPEKQEFDSMFEEYEDTLKTSNLLDFDDLLLRCEELLREHPDCVSNIEAVLIDEFQDTNHIQYELMTLFSQARQRITIVGDPDQSIYAFRCAEVENVWKMRTQYPQTHIVLLEENYRSSGSILLSALGVIEQDESRPAKALMPTHATGERPVLRRLPHPKAEAQWMMEELKRIVHLTTGLFTYKDFAILVRSGFQSQAIELALGEAGVPYRMVGGHKFFERREIKILLSYLRVIHTPEHNDAMLLVINEPPRGIGDATVKSLVEEAERRKIPLWQLIQNVAQERGKVDTKIKPNQHKSICQFFGLVTRARKKVVEADGAVIISELLDFLITQLSFERYLRKKYEDDADSRLENIEELRLQAAQLATQMEEASFWEDEALPTIQGVDQHSERSPEVMLGQFLSNVALATDLQVAQTAEDSAAANQVTISTMHGAKGLEWPVVFIPSLYDGSMPHSRSEDHDEERRLLYVAMTRAQAMLYLSCPTQTSGGSSATDTVLSPFLSPRNMSAFFDSAGPKMSFSIVQDLSRILRRDCPPESKLIEAYSTAKQREDNYWPLDGQNPPKDVNGQMWYGQTDIFDQQHPQKRRRVGQYDRPGQYVSVMSTHTTMLDRASFSVANTTISTTFTSAAACLKQQSAVTIAKGESSAKPEIPKRSDPVRKGLAPKETSSQGSLLSFFKNEMSTATTPGPNHACKPFDGESRAPHSLAGSTKLNKRSISKDSKPRQFRGYPVDFEEPMVFLSSSPPRGGENEPPGQILSKEKQATNVVRMRSLAPNVKPSTNVLKDSGVQGHLANGNRYLGIRRNAPSSAANKVNRPFKPPSRPNG